MINFKSVIINIFTSGLLLYGIFLKNIIALNLFTAITIIMFVFVFLVAFGLKAGINKPKIQEAIKVLKEREKSIFCKIIAKICILSNVIFLFGFGHWVKGFIWVAIYFIFEAYIKPFFEIPAKNQKAA